MNKLSSLVRLALVVVILPACGSSCGGEGKGERNPSPGDLDRDFGTGGVVDGIFPPDSSASAIVVDSDWMYLAGFDYGTFGGGEWRIEKRSLVDGTLDPAFGTSGTVFSNPTVAVDAAQAIALDGDSLYIGGNQGSDTAWRIEKRSTTTGALDGVFGGGSGAVTVNPTSGTDFLVALQVSGGAIYAVGFENEEGDCQWRIEKRSATTGALDGVFGATTGVIRSNPDTGEDKAYSLALDATSIYVVGLQYLGDGDYAWRIEKRDRATGALDATFGGGTGVVTSNPSIYSYEEARRVTLDGSSLFIAGYRQAPSLVYSEWKVEKRDAATGELDPAFGGGTGSVTTLGLGNASPNGGLVVDGANLYVAGGTQASDPLDLGWRIEKRNTSTGALVADFGNGGAVTTNPTTGYDWLNGIAVSSGSLFAIGSIGHSTERWRIEKRFK